MGVGVKTENEWDTMYHCGITISYLFIKTNWPWKIHVVTNPNAWKQSTARVEIFKMLFGVFKYVLFYFVNNADR